MSLRFRLTLRQFVMLTMIAVAPLVLLRSYCGYRYGRLNYLRAGGVVRIGTVPSRDFVKKLCTYLFGPNVCPGDVISIAAAGQPLGPEVFDLILREQPSVVDLRYCGIRSSVLGRFFGDFNFVKRLK